MQNAISAVENAQTPVAITPEMLSPAPGRIVPRNLLVVQVQPDATIDQVNGALLAIGAVGIVSTTRKQAWMTIQVPLQSSLEALEAMANRLRTLPGIRNVLMDAMAYPSALPPNTSAQNAADVGLLDAQLAIRAEKGWRLLDFIKANTTQKPKVVIVDNFGDGIPSTDLNVGKFSQQELPISRFKSYHGYAVTGVIFANFDDRQDPSISLDAQKFSGIYPVDQPVGAIDGMAGGFLGEVNAFPFSLLEDRVIAYALGEPNPRLIFSISSQFPCVLDCVAASSGFSEEFLLSNATKWVEKVRNGAVDLEGRFLIVSAAGNLVNAGAGDSTPWNAAALRLTGAERIKNVIVVEGRAPLPAVNGAYRGGCPDPRSSIGGHVSASGSSVSSIAVSDGAVKGTNLTTMSGVAQLVQDIVGTSFAAPQVTGLVAMLWGLKPDLSVQELKTWIERQAFDEGSLACPQIVGPVGLAPMIDVYSTLLAIDNADRKIRNALLDFNGDGDFDKLDLMLANAAYELGASHPDYSKFDLNGDGFSGGEGTWAFNLNPDGTVNSSLEENLEAVLTRSGGLQERVTFNEKKLKDQDILCYYAYSDLYRNPDAERDTLTEKFCPAPKLQINLGPEVCPDTEMIFYVQAMEKRALASGELGNFILFNHTVKAETLTAGGTLNPASVVIQSPATTAGATGAAEFTLKLLGGSVQLRFSLLDSAGRVVSTATRTVRAKVGCKPGEQPSLCNYGTPLIGFNVTKRQKLSFPAFVPPEPGQLVGQEFNSNMSLKIVAVNLDPMTSQFFGFTTGFVGEYTITSTYLDRQPSVDTITRTYDERENRDRALIYPWTWLPITHCSPFKNDLLHLANQSTVHTFDSWGEPGIGASEEESASFSCPVAVFKMPYVALINGLPVQQCVRCGVVRGGLVDLVPQSQCTTGNTRCVCG